MEYNKDDYRFTATMAIYKGRYLSRDDVIKHLSVWCPLVNWSKKSVGYGYRTLKNHLESRLNKFKDFEYAV